MLGKSGERLKINYRQRNAEKPPNLTFSFNFTFVNNLKQK